MRRNKSWFLMLVKWFSTCAKEVVGDRCGYEEESVRMISGEEWCMMLGCKIDGMFNVFPTISNSSSKLPLSTHHKPSSSDIRITKSYSPPLTISNCFP